MLRYAVLLPCALTLFSISADAVLGQSAAKDLYGDPLPPGALARLGTVRFRHDNPIVFAAFLPGGKSVLSVGTDGAVRAWEFPSGTEIGRFDALTAPAPRVTSATLSPDGKHLTAFCSDGYMRIWDWANAKELGKVATAGGNTNGPIYYDLYDDDYYYGGTGGRVYSPDGKTLMLTWQRLLQFVDLPNGKEIGPAQGITDPVGSILFTPNGERILTTGSTGYRYSPFGGRTREIKVTHTWEAATGKTLESAVVKMPATPGSPTVISPDGRIGVTVALFTSPAKAQAAKDREAIFFDTATGKKLGEITLAVEMSRVHSRPLLFAPNSKILAVNVYDANDKEPREKIALYEVPSGKLLRTLDAGPAAAVPKLGKGGKGGGGFGGGFPGGPGGFGFAGDGLQKLLFSSDGKALAFQNGQAGAIVVLDTTTGNQIATVVPAEGSLPLQGPFSPDGRCLAIPIMDGTVMLYELATGRPRQTYGAKWPQRPVKDDPFGPFGGGFDPGYSQQSRVIAAIAPDGKSLALSGPTGTVHVWDVLTAKELITFKGHTLTINALAFAPNGKTLASASDDTTALVWDMTKVARPAPAGRAVARAEIESWWKALADDDAGKAFTAMGELAAAPKEAVAWIKDNLPPAAPLDPKQVQALMRQLDDDQYKVRQKATVDLLKLGELLVPTIDATLATNPPPEMKKRLEELRDKLAGAVLQGERLRGYRAVEVLEMIGTSEARQLLRTLADGDPGAVLTKCARAALER
jgi:WD40 repeat protein